MPDFNLILNLAALVPVVLLVVMMPKYWRARDLEQQMAMKDRTIATNTQSIESLETRVAVLEADLRGAQERADSTAERNRKLSESLALMQGRYEEQSRYTAREALVTLERLLQHQGAEAERRHAELMEVLRNPPVNPQPST